MSKILYYPYIELPEESWTINSLLYWDEVGTIFPEAYEEKLNESDDFNSILFREGAIKKLSANDFEYNNPWFLNGLLEVLKGEMFNLNEKRTLFEQNHITDCYSEKADKEIYECLVQLGVASKISNSKYSVELHVANLLIFKIANEIGKLGEFVPSTDDEHYIKPDFFRTAIVGDQNTIRQELLSEILPSPLEFNVSDLLNFKEKYKLDLQDFRLEVELLCDTLSGIKNIDERLRIKQRNIQQVNKRIEHVVSLMKDSKFKRIIKSSWLGVTVSTTLMAVTGTPTPLIGAAVNLGSSIRKAFTQAPAEGDPLRYIGLLNNNFNKNNT